MHKLNVLLLLLLLAGCGEVTVFGHVVREGHPKTEVAQQSSVSASSASAAQTVAQATSSSSSSHSTASSALATPVIPPITSAQPATPAALARVVTGANNVNATIQPVKTVTLSIAPDMLDKTSADSHFDSKVLLETIKAELQSRKLLDSSDPQGARTLTIYIDNYDLHATTNFSIFGARPYNGTLAGNLALLDEQGEHTPVSHVEAYSRISIADDGEDKNPLQPLYRDFAITVANSLAGTPMSTNAEHNQPPR